MKLFMFISYDDWVLKVCKEEEVENEFKSVMGCRVDGNFNRIEEVNEVDGYGIRIIEYVGEIPKKRVPKKRVDK